ncbi:MAG: dicarboxylate/amino acid:cation symporter [Cellvibrionales bacterium TMED49]|nr:dicarboxylate/amino acid:cation symporter [Porticoccaceae bacterium]OUU38969.1 MAG: dicarboxylate/amino acid:cation symporter [Cellvibrionales bacterium TMED49]
MAHSDNNDDIKIDLTKRIVVAMLFGLIVGVMLNSAIQGELFSKTTTMFINLYLVEGLFDTVGQIFVRTLKLMVVPLVFVSLLCGTASLGSNTKMGLLAGKSILLYMVTTALAISSALILAIFMAPGQGVDLTATSNFSSVEAPELKSTLINIFPSNPVAAMAEGQVLQVIVFALLMGLALAYMGDSGKRLLDFFKDINSLVMKMVMLLMQLAPIGIFCLLAKLFTGLGIAVIVSLATYFFTVVFALLLHCFGVYSILLRTMAGLNPIKFFMHMRSPMTFAFSTASSAATMPVTLRAVEYEVGVDPRVASFTVPLGATINMDGTAIMQGVATVFISQAYNIDLSVEAYLIVILTATLASIGTAAVPGVGLVMLVMVLNQVGLPVEGIGLIIGVDRLLDMLRTAVNVAGDGTVSACVAHSEGLHNRRRFYQLETEKATTRGIKPL